MKPHNRRHTCHNPYGTFGLCNQLIQIRALLANTFDLHFISPPNHITEALKKANIPIILGTPLKICDILRSRETMLTRDQGLGHTVHAYSISGEDLIWFVMYSFCPISILNDLHCIPLVNDKVPKEVTVTVSDS